MKKVMLALAVIVAVSIAPNLAFADGDAAVGEALFNSKKGRCAGCHSPTDEIKTGPGLKGVMTRTDEAWVASWLKDSKAVWTANEGYVVTLKAKMGKEGLPKPAHKTRPLKDEQIVNLIAYLKTL